MSELTLALGAARLGLVAPSIAFFIDILSAQQEYSAEIGCCVVFGEWGAMRRLDGSRSGMDWATRSGVSDSASSVSLSSEVSRRRVRTARRRAAFSPPEQIRSKSLTHTRSRKPGQMDAELQDVSEVLHDEADLSALELADGLLENVVHCPDCSKPVLQSALEDHAATCQAIREGRPPPTSHPLKRRLSEGQPETLLSPRSPANSHACKQSRIRRRANPRKSLNSSST